MKKQANPADGFARALLVDLDRSAPRTFRRQLERAIREAIADGRLEPGAPLPPSRTLAAELRLSRSVVVEAYGNLVAAGYLSSRRGSGTRVSSRAAGPAADGAPHDVVRRPYTARFQSGLPDPASFPRRVWERHYRAVLAGLPDSAFTYPDPQGAIELRRALASYLGRVRSVTASHDRVLVCNGFAQGLVLVCRALRARGVEAMAVEDPCFAHHRRLIENAGLAPVPVAVDEDGLRVEDLRATGAGAVLVAPAHSYPSGAVLSPERRVALLRWAAATGAVVVEDDYDAEFRYDRAPVAALQGLAPDRVVYGGSTSKMLSPLLRLGWLVAPEWLIGALVREKLLDDMASSMLEQLTLARFVDDGALTRHLRRMGPVYRARREAALRAVAEHLPGAEPAGVPAGLHLFVRLPEECDERALVDAARRRGVRVEGAAVHYADPRSAPPALVLGYGAVSEQTVERGVAAFGEAYRAFV